MARSPARTPYTAQDELEPITLLRPPPSAGITDLCYHIRFPWCWGWTQLCARGKPSQLSCASAPGLVLSFGSLPEAQAGFPPLPLCPHDPVAWRRQPGFHVCHTCHLLSTLSLPCLSDSASQFSLVFPDLGNFEALWSVFCRPSCNLGVSDVFLMTKQE